MQRTTHGFEIATLTLNGNNITPAVFAQIPHRPLIRDGRIDGTPWGKVNHTPDDATLHVVYEHASTLNRDTIDPAPDHPPLRTNEGNLLFTACIHAKLHGHDVTHLDGNTDTVDGVTSEFAMAPAALTALRAEQDLESAREALAKLERQHAKHGGYTKRITKQQAAVAEAHQALTDTIAALDTELADAGTLDTLYAAYANTVAAEAGRRARHQATVSQLADLPQLYLTGGGDRP